MRRQLMLVAAVSLTWVAPLSGDGTDAPRVRRHLPRASAAACGSPTPVSQWPPSGYYLEMVAAGEVFHVWVTSEGGMARVRTWLGGDRAPAGLGIPGAPIELDPTFNPGFSYRLKPGAVTFADAWIELCDGAPCYVERDPAAWAASPGTWCPWAAQVRKVWDCSAGDGTSCGDPVFQNP